MNCSPNQIEAYLDEELDAAEQAEMERHFAACPDCSAVYARFQKQKAGIKAAAPYYSAPSKLRQSVRDALQRAGSVQAKPPAREAPWRWMAIAASVLLVISVSWNLRQVRSRSFEGDLAEGVLANHIRSLLGTHLVDVPSSDQHTVKPWFAGKLDFSPAVRDLDAQGFRLAGGRIEYLSGRRVAALVYYRRQHVINLFIWPGGSSSGSENSTSRDGYNLLEWTDGSMIYWAVSDVSAADLKTFRTLFR